MITSPAGAASVTALHLKDDLFTNPIFDLRLLSTAQCQGASVGTIAAGAGITAIRPVATRTVYRALTTAASIAAVTAVATISP